MDEKTITILDASRLAKVAARVFHGQAYGVDCAGKCHPDRAAPAFSYTGNIQGGGHFRVTVELVEGSGT
jgi:hypothetical protein